MASGAPIFLDASAVESLLPLPSLVDHLRSTLRLSSSIHTPLRHHHQLSAVTDPGDHPNNPSSSSSLLLMPSWSTAPAVPYLGVKVLTSYPSSSPSLHSLYTLFHSLSGATLASLDASPLTLLRTAAVSALASLLLSPASPETLLLVGSGALAPHLARAHLLARPSIRRVLVWNRTPSRSISLVRTLSLPDGVRIEHSPDLDAPVAEADVICCATGSEEPLVRGDLVRSGAHVDLVGSYRPAMRECDDGLMGRARVFVDCQAAVEEAGEVVGAVRRGIISGVEGTLVELRRQEKVGRRSEEEVTVFKSVGSGAVDLIAAGLAYENHLRLQGEFPH